MVTDPSGAAIAGAEIIVVNDATRVQVVSKSNDEGIYAVPNLIPGNYRVQVSKDGFKTIIKSDIIVNSLEREPSVCVSCSELTQSSRDSEEAEPNLYTRHCG
jgi:hypothetical protein